MHKTISRYTVVLAASVTTAFLGSAAALAAPASPTSSTAASSLSFSNVVINPASTRAYFTVPADNEVAILNLTTGKFLKPIPVGSDPQGIDITPDGKTLYVADSGGQTISVVTAATRKVTTITTPAGTLNDTPYSIAVLNNSTALYTTTFAGSGYGGQAYSLDLATGASTVVPGIGIGGQVTEVSPVSRSANHAVAGVVIGDDSGGRFDVYTAATGGVVSGSLNEFISSSALNAKGSTMIVDGTSVIGASSGAVLGTISDSCVSAVLNASGKTGYCLTSSSIVVLNTTTFLTGKTIALPSGVTGTGELAISPNGKLLVAETSAGATIVSI
jgi:YVTN family beta-propeller protein